MKQQLRDRSNRPIGTITVTVNGRLEGRDANGRLKGTYDPKSDQTKDSNGRVVGWSNVLTAVVTSSLFGCREAATMNTKKKLDPAIMAQFNGSETFYRYGLAGDVLFTEGVKYVVDTAGGYWLLDIICITNIYEPKIRGEEFQLWTLSVWENSTGYVTCDDGNGNVVYEQALNLTDFPSPGIKLYFCNGTILLPNEY